ncbi:enoyl-CoA hydratase-related protein [Phaeobacter gallaeciensis]|uniref:enoyl-CoA hydratase-related protein n=1 Tax=Phaeobacter gallaeciensis TaxID=60890 RepID=UPI00237FAC7D|nr:enoyl-CoA hydratase-related protein [Phaeobacter gallaeciensis]MDE4098344.1 enoyl-CoA hydratase-related protein [Phaeobacter gallaeciensis]MDE4107154.1 enoyl-CoA hydratase-related protein [Phaeobacter gallaeciensis]MDE4111387.1 enoyl-CoA hydratase-related protein [Phaeobacter gallaeciensis]MDE4116079.1 enoyl-CoA hydratase-related protein [Phaeobacter gallaeciensis]MDE4120328.1 enoyl-CoA hydratase-related protein [Phaeobacter gallaeciensis]
MSLVLIERPGDRVGVIRLNRPERRNALSTEFRAEIAKAVTELDADPGIRCIVMTGDEKAFAAGADLAELAEVRPMQEVFDRLGAVKRALEASNTPAIAAVRGMALGGGCEMAMMCDIIIAGDTAKFGQPEIKVGIMPGAGGTQKILRTAGKAKALRYLLTGDLFPADVALDLGIVSEVVPDAEVMDTSLAMAKRIAAQPAKAVQAIRDAVREGANTPLDTALMLENRLFQMLFSTDDQKEGMRAFLEKRAPEFKGQ